MKMETNKIYKLKDKDKLVFTGKQIREFKKKVIEDYRKSEYFNKVHQKARIKGYDEAIEGIRQYVINEVSLDPKPCCHGIRITSFLEWLKKLKEKGDRRYVLEQKHIDIIKQRLKEGESKNAIAKELGVSVSTIVYWTNPVFRRRQREKNAKHRFGKKLISVDELLNKEVKQEAMQSEARHSSQA